MAPAAAPEFFDADTPCAVLTPEPLGGALDYRAPDGGAWLGAFVQVPLGPRRVLGVVWGPAEGRLPRARLRAVIRVLDAAPMRAELRDFLARLADYTLAPLPMVLRLATRVPGLTDGPVTRKLIARGPATPARLTDARARVLAALDGFGGAGLAPAELAQAAGVGTGVVRARASARTISASTASACRFGWASWARRRRAKRHPTRPPANRPSRKASSAGVPRLGGPCDPFTDNL